MRVRIKNTLSIIIKSVGITFKFDFRFYTECLLPEIVNPKFGRRFLKSDIAEPSERQQNIFKKKNSSNQTILLIK